MKAGRRLKAETAIARLDGGDAMGDPVALTCPDCGGPILEIVDGELMPRYRCQVGHAYSANAMLAGRLECVERELWHLVSSYEEVARVADALAREAGKERRKREGADFRKTAGRARKDARVIRGMIRRSV